MSHLRGRAFYSRHLSQARNKLSRSHGSLPVAGSSMPEMQKDSPGTSRTINTQPHGEYTIKDNDFPGQFCLHMVGSRTHETNKVNPEHQASIERVLKWSASS